MTLKSLAKIHLKEPRPRSRIAMKAPKKHTFVVGDVHGEFDTLKALLERLPEGARVIFAGDLIDRGKKSRETLKFIRESGFECVLGNHEDKMLKFARDMSFSGFKRACELHKGFLERGGFETLASYGICKRGGAELANKKWLEEFFEDMHWLAALPVYLETGVRRNRLPVVVSHAPMAERWSERGGAEFREIALTSRKNPPAKTLIFNVFGHTPQKEVLLEPNFANVDTGCCYGKKLSALCIETGEIVSANHR